MSVFYCICDKRSKLGESPRWSPGEGRIYWTDIDGKRLWRANVDGQDAQGVDLDQKAGCLVFRQKGGLVLAMEDGIYAGDPFAGESLEMLCPHPDMAFASDGGRFNDGRCSPDGRFYVGTLDPKRKGRAAFYVLEPGEKQLKTVQSGYNTFNGIAFHPDGNQIWYSDTPRYELYRSSYDSNSGKIGEREVVRSWDPGTPARPDGGSFDTNGNYWCAMYAGGRVLRIDQAGEILAEHLVEATYTTMPAFVGDGLDKMVLTTGLRDDDPDETTRNPSGGCLFMFDNPGAVGLDEPAFAG